MERKVTAMAEVEVAGRHSAYGFITSSNDDGESRDEATALPGQSDYTLDDCVTLWSVLIAACWLAVWCSG